MYLSGGNNMNIIKKYWDAVYVYILLIVPLFCMCAGIYWTVCKFLSLYPEVSYLKLGLFDLSQLIYLTISIYFIIKIKRNSSYIETHLSHLKTFLTVVLFIQYNLILTFFPSDFVWVCIFVFLGVVIVFFDFKSLIIHSIFYVCTFLLRAASKPEALLPLAETNYAEKIIFNAIIFCLTLILFLLAVYFAENFLIQIQEKEKETIYLLEKQLDYYKDMAVMDQEIRKFRHDILNHFSSMKYLLEQKDYAELHTYFHDLEISFTPTRTIYFSGNTIIDAILHDELPRHCQKKVKVSISGTLPTIKTVSSMDLCTIFSNLLSNAINAANKCDAELKPEIFIHFNHGINFFSIEVTNSVYDDFFENMTKKKR